MGYRQPDEQKRRQDRNWEVSGQACWFLGTAVETTKKNR